MGKPLLISADLDSELSLTVAKGGFGAAVPAGDAKAVAEAVRNMGKSPELCLQMGERGRKAVWAWDRKSVLGGFLERIEKISPNGSNP